MYRLILILLSCFCLNLQAQTDTTRRYALRHQIGFDIRPAYITPTNSFLKGENAGQKPIRSIASAHLKWAFRFNPQSRLGRLYPYAYQGLGIAYNRTSNSKELGNPMALYVFQGSRIAQLSHCLSLDYEWNFGASFGWKEFNEKTNGHNMVIGSDINAYMNIGFMLNWKLNEHWNLTAGIDLSHYSNGNTRYPNAGINPIGGRIGIVHTFGNDYRQTSIPSKPHHLTDNGPFAQRMSYDVVLYGSTRKKGLIKEEKAFMIPGSFGIAGLNFTPLYRFTPYIKAGLSLDLQYDESANIKDYYVEGTPENDPKFHRPPFSEQFSAGISARGELSMPIFSINAGIGYNVIQKGKDTRGFYQVLALKTFVTKRLFLHIGYQLHDFKDPNNLMLGLGYRL